MRSLTMEVPIILTESLSVWGSYSPLVKTNSVVYCSVINRGSNTTGHFIWNLWNEPLIWNNHSCKILFVYILLEWSRTDTIVTHSDLNIKSVYSSLSHNLGRSSWHHTWLCKIPFHLALFSAALAELAKSIPVPSFILSIFSPLLVFILTVPWRIVFAKPAWALAKPSYLFFFFFFF